MQVNIRCSIFQRVSVFGEFLRFVWNKIIVCSIGKSIRYRRLSSRPSSPAKVDMESVAGLDEPTTYSGYDTDSDLVTLKISLLGDCQIGKTSFVVSI